MRLNHVQKRLIQELLEYGKQKFPEISLDTIEEGPEDPDYIWVSVKGIDWHDDDRIMDFTEYMSLKQDDILVEYGYPISVMPIRLWGNGNDSRDKGTIKKKTPRSGSKLAKPKRRKLIKGDANELAELKV